MMKAYPCSTHFGGLCLVQFQNTTESRHPRLLIAPRRYPSIHDPNMEKTSEHGENLRGHEIVFGKICRFVD